MLDSDLGICVNHKTTFYTLENKVQVDISVNFDFLKLVEHTWMRVYICMPIILSDLCTEIYYSLYKTISIQKLKIERMLYYSNLLSVTII